MDHETSGDGGPVVVKLGEKCVESEDEEEGSWEEKDVGKKMWDFVSFSRSDSCVWIMFQISLRLMVSFGVALLFFYLITKPPSPVISLKVTFLSQ